MRQTAEACIAQTMPDLKVYTRCGRRGYCLMRPLARNGICRAPALCDISAISTRSGGGWAPNSERISEGHLRRRLALFTLVW